MQTELRVPSDDSPGERAIPRRPKEQSDEMVQAIRKTGGRVEYLLFEDEAHGFRTEERH